MHDPKDHILMCILFIKWKINHSYKHNLETTVFKSLPVQDVQMSIWVWQGTSLWTVEESWRLHFSLREREKYCVKDDVMPQQVKWELFLLHASVVPKESSGPMLYFVSPRVPVTRTAFPQTMPKFESFLCAISAFSSSKCTYPQSILSSSWCINW